MSSTFGGIIQAGSGLTAASYAIQVVSQNIDNADTPGYTRQTSQQAAADGVAGVPTIYATRTGMAGVNVTATVRDNDPVLDARLRQEQARSAVTDTTASTLSSVENVFPEPSDTGLTEELNSFWNAWAGVANDPSNPAPRQVLLGSANTVTNMLNSMSGSLQDIVTSNTQSLNNVVSNVNSQATQLLSLNKQIAVGYASGQDVNSLLDQRDTLLSQLSSEADVSITYNTVAVPTASGGSTNQPNGTVSVSIGGQPLVVWPDSAAGTTAKGVNTLAYDSTTNTLSVSGSVPTTITAGTVTLTGGTALALQTSLQADPSETNPNTISYYQHKLDDVASALANAVNTAQANGYTVAGIAGAPLFSGTTAAGISVAITDPNAIAASSSSGGNLDGTNALNVSKYGTTLPAPTTPPSSTPVSPDKIYQALVGTIGQASALAQQAQTTQDSVTSSVQSLQNAASGVSTDEEVSNLLTFQRAYQASSRVLSTMDSLLDTLINSMGVGS